MKCLICHSDDIERKTVYEVFEQGDDIVRLPVEVPVCGCCGERYYDRATMRKIERFRDRLKDQSLPLTRIFHRLSAASTHLTSSQALCLPADFDVCYTRCQPAACAKRLI